MRILGLDPGLEHTGYGVIDVTGNTHTYIACGRITTKAGRPLAVRLAELGNALAALLAQHQPTHAAVEETFVNINAKSSLALGHARGVCLLVPTQLGVEVAEYATRLVKKSLVGTGSAEKGQIQHMVKVLLPLSRAASADAADALAVALTHAHHLTSPLARLK